MRNNECIHIDRWNGISERTNNALILMMICHQLVNVDMIFSTFSMHLDEKKKKSKMEMQVNKKWKQKKKQKTEINENNCNFVCEREHDN